VAVGGKTKQRRPFLIGAIILIIVASLGFLAYDFWLMDQKTKAVLGAPGIIVKEDKNNPEKAREGSETTAITKDDLSSYTVAADVPRVLTIDKLGIEARIRPMSLNKDKSIQAPQNIYDAGWYTGSAKPGANGAMFIDGHASGSTRLGIFATIDTLKVGDTMQVEKGDGMKLTYEVVHVATIPLTAIDMSQVLAPYAGVSSGLNLMTCTGTWLKDSATLDHRVVVYTKQI